MTAINSVNLRAVVLDMLLENEKNGEFSNYLLNNALAKYQYLEKSQRSFIAKLFIGTIERKIELDYICNQFSKTKANKMKPLIRSLIRMSIYQLMYMDMVPESAVCNEAVKLANKRGFSNLKGFVNGVLRNIARNKDSIKYPDSSDFVLYNSIKYSMPEWIIEMWLKDYEKEVVSDILAGFFKEKRTYIRVNTNKTTVAKLEEILTKEGVTVKKTDIDYALEISGYDYLTNLDSFNEGLFTIQDLSSIIAGFNSNIKEGDIVLDVCAAPGGKSVNASLLTKEKGRVYSRDISYEKTDKIEENLDRLGLLNVDVDVFDATDFDEDMVNKCDVVIADLPCSGLGIIGRKPDIKYNATMDKCRELVKIQKDILVNATKYVKDGAFLIYSTCTINKEENEDQVRFIESLGFKCEEKRQLLPGLNSDTDGFFYARMKKL